MDGQHTPGVLERVTRWYFVPGQKPWPSSLSVVVNNLFMLFGVLFLHWDVFVIMFLYWAENVIIGVFNVLRMLFAGKGGAGKLFHIPFFCFHYGAFCLAHSVFIGIFGGLTYDVHNPLLPVVDALFSYRPGAALMGMLAYAPWISISLLLIVFNQVVSFVRHYLLSDEFRTMDCSDLFGLPYGRIIKLHTAIFFGGILIIFTGSNRYGMCLIIIGKMLYDLRAYWQERAKPPVPAVEPVAALEEKPLQKRKSRRRRKRAIR